MNPKPIDNSLNLSSLGQSAQGDFNGVTSGNNDPAAAAAARSRIAAINAINPPANRLPEPISPAAELIKPSFKGAAALSPARAAASNSGSLRRLPSPVKPILSAVATFVFMVLVFRSGVIVSQIKYFTDSKPTEPVMVTPAAATVGPEPSITIPKIKVSAPVVYGASNDEESIQKALHDGVVHYSGTAKPGQRGNTVIVGHSSNDLWEAGDYKFVFVLLDKLIIGDTFSVNYEGRRYTYEVFESKIVEPTDLSVLASTDQPTITLITCSPPGTSWKRLIIKAKQVDPAPDGMTPIFQPLESASTGILPSNAPSFGEQIGDAWRQLSIALNRIFGQEEANEN